MAKVPQYVLDAVVPELTAQYPHEHPDALQGAVEGGTWEPDGQGQGVLTFRLPGPPVRIEFTQNAPETEPEEGDGA